MIRIRNSAMRRSFDNRSSSSRLRSRSRGSSRERYQPQQPPLSYKSNSSVVSSMSNSRTSDRILSGPIIHYNYPSRQSQGPLPSFRKVQNERELETVNINVKEPILRINNYANSGSQGGGSIFK